MLVLFTSTILLSALLLFLIQPLVAKIIIPFLGGTPAVWNTCLFFFQSVLLCGYLYAHLLTGRLGFRQQAVLHAALLCIALTFLPISIDETGLDKASSPLIWLLGCLTTTVGMPFFMVSTSGPLLQRWFSQSGQTSANDPYFLYAASNFGSLLALIAYPVIVEPNLRLSIQNRLWTLSYAILVALMITCVMSLVKGPIKIPGVEEPSQPVNRARQIWWVALAFAPASLMYGVTTYLITDIVSVPLLWVLPLSVYLLSFILVFARRRLLPRGLFNRLMPLVAIVLTFLVLTKLPRPIWLLGALHLLFLFIASMVCHGRLADDRPSSKDLTKYYLWMSLGGALGGLFNCLIAPVIFDTVVEYPLAVVLCLLLRNRNRTKQSTNDWPDFAWLDFAWPAAIGLLTAGLALTLQRFGVAPTVVVVATLVVPLLLIYAWAMRPLRFALAIGAVMIGSIFFQGLYYGHTLHIERSFFGVLRVTRDQTGAFHQLFNGNTGHGRQFTASNRQCEPLSYYHRRGPLGQVFELFNSRPGSQRVAVIGLGTGAAVSYSAPNQEWTIYEIDPDVIGIARETRYFTYLKNCASSPHQIITGDARLKIRDAPESYFGLIVLDAFSSDVIPTHLITRQAFDLYLSKLAPGGILALHTSNQYLDLRPVLADLIVGSNLAGIVRTDLGPFQDEKDNGRDACQWMIVARNKNDLGSLAADERWQGLEVKTGIRAWTDDYSNIIGVFKW